MEYLAAGLSIGSSIFGAVGALQGGQAAAAQGRYNAAMQRYQAQLQEREGLLHDYAADLAKERAEADIFDIRREVRRTQGSVRAQAGASGFSVDEGNAAEVQIENAELGELTALRRRWQGDIEAYNEREQAVMARAGAAASRSQAGVSMWLGQEALNASYFRAASSLLTGFSRVGSFSRQNSTSTPTNSGVGSGTGETY